MLQVKSSSIEALVLIAHFNNFQLFSDDFNPFHQLMHVGHVLLHLPNLLEALSTELAGQLLLVDLPFLTVVDVLDVRGYVVAVEETLPTDFAL